MPTTYKSYQIIVVDDTGSTTHTPKALDMIDAMKKVLQAIKTINPTSIVSITATTL